MSLTAAATAPNAFDRFFQRLGAAPVILAAALIIYPLIVPPFFAHQIGGRAPCLVQRAHLAGAQRFNTLIGAVFLVIVFVSPDGILGLWERLKPYLAATSLRAP